MKLIFIVSILKFHCDEINTIQIYTNTLQKKKKKRTNKSLTFWLNKFEVK